MKRKQSTEPDLFVVSKKLTDKESKEISDFIRNYKAKKADALKKNKHRKAAQFNNKLIHGQFKKTELKDMLNEIKKVDARVALHSSDDATIMLQQYNYLRHKLS